MNILIVVSQYDPPLSSLKEEISLFSQAGEFVICPIHAGLQERVEELRQFITAKAGVHCSLVPFSRRLLEHSLKVKDQYLQFISDLGNREVLNGISLKEYFRYRSKEYSLWWLSQVYEKSPGKSDAFLHFVKVSLLETLAVEHDCREIWISSRGKNADYREVLTGLSNIKVESIGDPRRLPQWVKDARLLIKESLRVLRYFFFLLGVRLRTAFQPKPVIPQNCRRFVITMFPFFDQKKFEEGKFYSKAYGPLQDHLESDKDNPLLWLAMHTKIEPYTWKESFRLAGRVKAFAGNFFSVDDFIRLRDIFCIDLDFLRLAARFIKALERISALPVLQTQHGGRLNLWPLLREDFFSSFAGKTAVVNLHYLRIFRNIIERLPAGSVVIHFAEMHAWERSLQMTAKSRNIKVVALQHAHVPQLLLNYFDHPQDLTDEDFMRSVPQPDALGAVGSVIRNYFFKQGWPEKKLFVAGGFRFQALAKNAQLSKETARDPRVLVAAFSICYNENLEMLQMLRQTFNEKMEGVKVVIKSHPAESVEKMAQREGIPLNRDIFSFSDAPLESIVPDSLGMFACSTSSVFYAMACRKPVIVPCLFDAIDLCPLTNLYPYEFRVDDAMQLRSALHDILSGRYDSNRLEKYWNELFKDYLGLDKDFREHFDKLKMHLK